MKIPLKQIRRTQSGVSLVEVIMVLGIASLMIGGAFAWFDTQKSSDFYNEVRQVESRIREVQSQNTSSQVPGYDLSGTSVCNNEDREIGGVKCVLGKGEEVFGTAVAIAVPNPGDTFVKLKTIYLKKGPESTTAPIQSLWVESYGGVKEVDLPASLKFEGFKIFGDGLCTSGSYNSWRNLPYLVGAGGTDYTTAGNESMIVFRRTTGGYNAFWPTNPTNFVRATANASRPAWVGAVAPSDRQGWVGSYDDATYQYSPTPTGADATNRLKSQPCAVLWRFGSTERDPSDASKPRFSADINFNLVDGTTTLVTR